MSLTPIVVIIVVVFTKLLEEFAPFLSNRVIFRWLLLFARFSEASLLADVLEGGAATDHMKNFSGDVCASD